MALEQRQTQIEVGAGQTESQLNRDFVDFLKKWSSPILFIIAAVVVGFWGLKQYRAAQDAKIAAAFTDLDAQLRLNSATQRTPIPVGANPKILMQVAQEHAGKGSVEYVALLSAADAWLVGAIRGVQPGAEFDPTSGALKDPKDLLAAADKKDFLDRAAEQYKRVADATAGKPDVAILFLRGKFGQAAVDETRGQFDAAIESYKAAEKAATDALYPGLAKIAHDRVADMDKIKAVGPLPTDASVQTITPVVATPPNMPNLPPGVTMEPLPGPPPGFSNPVPSPGNSTSPIPTPAPAPAPAPTTPAPSGTPTPAPAPSPGAPKP
ncbi:MAG: hypothetical protein ACREJO_14540 [Phycisphaerales bacterium]